MTKRKKPTLPKLLKRADTVFSTFIRTRDNYTCVLCGSRFRPQNGHLIKRGKKNVRFDEDNCHCQCSSCNYKHNHYPEIYINWFIRKFGAEKFDTLTEKSKVMKQFKVWELEEIISKYDLTNERILEK